MRILSGFLVFCLIITCGYIVGLLKFLTDYEIDQCEMTYMFEYPQFVRISHEIDKKYPKYELYAYSEGRLTERARKMDFTGIPVLFIPGNRGSYKQVRSLASIALRKALTKNAPYHFDYFTVNLNEEFSGISGVLLNDQLNYVNHSIYRVLDLYKGKNAPTSVILVGHSMGGVLAYKILTTLDSESSLIPIVITLATPLKRPPVLFDPHLNKFYEGLSTNIPDKSTFISLAGGFSDFLIPASLTNVKNQSIIQAVTTNIPLSNVEANHVQILWCKQTVLAINRALFDSVDLKTKQISEDVLYRDAVFKHHLINNSGIKIRQIKSYSDKYNINPQGLWTAIQNKQYTVSLLKGVKQMQWYMVPLKENNILSILAVNLEVTDWVFLCQANSDGKCTNGVHLSHKSLIAPSAKYKRRTIRINMQELLNTYQGMTHVMVRVLPTDEPVVLHFDIYKKMERTLVIDLPKVYSLKKQVVTAKTKKNSLDLELTVPDLQHVYQSYNLLVEPRKCLTDYHHATAQLSAPWANQNTQQHYTNEKSGAFNVRLHSSRPNNNNKMARIKFTLDPSCEYEISIQANIMGILGQLSRHYNTLLLTNVAAVVLLTFRTQLKNFQDGSFPLFFTAMAEGLKPYYTLTAVKLLSKFLSNPFIVNVLPVPDWDILKDDGMEFLFLPLLLYMTSVGIVWILVVVFSVSVVVTESSMNTAALKFLAKTVRFPVTWTEYLLSALHKLPFVVACILIFVSIRACGGLALCLGTLFYFLKLTQMSQDYIEEVFWFFIKNYARMLKKAIAKRFSRKKNEERKNLSIENAVVIKNEDTNIVEEVKNEVVDKNEDTDKEPIASTSKIEDLDEKIKETEEDEIKEQKPSEIEEIPDEQIEELEENDSQIVGDENQIEEVQNLVENETERSNRQIKFTAHNTIFFHSSIFFIWTLLTLVNVPIVLTWAHNFKYSIFLTPDPSFLPGMVLSICAFPLWQMDLPKRKRWNKEVSEIILGITGLVLIYAPISIYRLNYFLTFVIVLVLLHQIFAPNELIEEENESKNNIEEKYENVKAKLD
ncbi:unnamed protein product [Brassicogethes aeneus]|uniref:GPI inositol-deacylase n=1 Tax=Brassicogethes aeneus TaxID=1431903 RepID=A0A9P0BLA2_BRAAE|nr:unnamed protein product [Brassicogethes aeneus]